MGQSAWQKHATTITYDYTLINTKPSPLLVLRHAPPDVVLHRLKAGPRVWTQVRVGPGAVQPKGQHVRELDARHGAGRQAAGVQDRELGEVAGGVVNQRQHPAVVLGLRPRPRHKDRLLGEAVGAGVVEVLRDRGRGCAAGGGVDGDLAEELGRAPARVRVAAVLAGGHGVGVGVGAADRRGRDAGKLAGARHQAALRHAAVGEAEGEAGEGAAAHVLLVVPGVDAVKVDVEVLQQESREGASGRCSAISQSAVQRGE